MNQSIRNVDLGTYAQLASRMWPGAIGLSICDDFGVVIQTSGDVTDDMMARLATAHPEWVLMAESACRLDIDERYSVLPVSLRQEVQHPNLFLVWIIDNTISSDWQAVGETFDKILPLSVCLRNDIGLNVELDSMATELGERYEELNLVYHTDDQVSYMREGHQALCSLVQNCAVYLDTGLAILFLRDKKIFISSRGAGDEIDVELVRRAIKGEIYDTIVNCGDTVMLNNSDILRASSTEKLPYRLIGIPITGVGDQIDGILIMVNRLTDKLFTNSDRNLLSVMTKKVAKIIHGSYDGLTGLLNRASFEHFVDEELLRVERRRSERCVLHVNIDKLHRINDTLGHESGDHVILHVAKCIENQLRDSDMMARVGGDEVGILLQDCDPDNGKRICRKLIMAVADRNIEWKGERLWISVSVGAAQLDDSAPKGEEFLKRAVMACDIAKEQGGNRAHFYQISDSELQFREENMWMVGKVKAALREDRFLLYGQSIAPLQPNGVPHIEVLLRMKEGEEVLTPNVFMPASERYQLMCEIDEWVLGKTLDALARWQAAGHVPPVCGINLSGQSICEEHFLTFVANSIRMAGVPPELLCFEITETAAIANLEQAKVFIAALRQLGCVFALDDFGAGLSSFGYLKSFDVQFLKIDGSLVRDIATDPMSEAMVASVNEIGKVLGLQTIAEFVEDQQMQSILKRLGVDYAQGYHIDKPMPLADLLEKYSESSIAAAS